MLKTKEISLKSVKFEIAGSGTLMGVIEMFAYFLLGILMSRAVIFDKYAPFGVSAAACCKRRNIIPVLIGSFFGYIMPGGTENSLRYIAAAVAVTGIKWSLDGLLKFVNNLIFAPFTAFLAVTGTGLAMLYASEFTAIGALMICAEGLLAGGAAFFLRSATDVIDEKRMLMGLNAQELTGVVISAGIALISLASVEIGGLSPGRMTAVFLILVSARYGKESGGAIAGICTGLVMSLTGSGVGYLAGSYAFGGLMAGVFSPLGKIGCAAAFVLANGVSAIYTGGGQVIVGSLFEVMAATVIFVLLPGAFSSKLSAFFRANSKMEKVSGLRENVVMRLNFASKALGDVAEAVEAVSQKLLSMSAPNVGGVFLKASDDICKNCKIKMYCWETQQSSTMNAFNDMSLRLLENGEVEKEYTPEYFAARCVRLDDLLRAVNRHYIDYQARQSAERRVSEVRNVVSDQFEGMSEMLYDLSNEFIDAESFDPLAQEKVSALLKALGVTPVDVSCHIDKFSRMTAEIICKIGEKHINRGELVSLMSKSLERNFDVPCVSCAQEVTRITVAEKANFDMEIGVSQHALSGNTLCGDAYEYFNDGSGRIVMIISDGMGSGGRAAVDGAMASGLLTKLIKAGFGFDCSLRIVNSAMLVKSGEESLATLDVMCFDQFTGKSEILKAGAPVSVIFKSRHKKTSTVGSSSLPAGILREIDFERNPGHFDEDDIIVMVSDGAIATGTDWIEAELESFRGSSAQKLAEKIVDLSVKRRNDKHDDDITVMVGIVKKGI